MTLTVLTWKWGTRYSAAHVNRLARQVAKHYERPHRFACITNQPEGIECETIRDTGDFATMLSPHGAAFPSCYRRLRMWQSGAAFWFGERFVSLDLDVTLHADVTPLWDRPEDVVLYRDPLYPTQFNGSMLLMSAGARPDVWNDFGPGSPSVAKQFGKRGSDQAWISHKLKNEATWGPEDGVYSYRAHCQKGLPKDARVTVWHGRQKPWMHDAPAWAKEAA